MFDDCEMRDTRANAVYFIGGNRDVLVRGCEIHSEDTTNFKDGIAFYNAGNERIAIIDTEIYHVAHAGISAHAVNGLTISGCSIHDTMSHGVSVGGDAPGAVTGVVIEDNRIWNVEGWGVPSTSPHNGVRLHDYYGDVLVAGNDIWNCDGRAVDLRPNGGELSARIINNTFWNCDLGDYDSGALQIQNTYVGTGDNPTVEVRNNLIYHTRPGAIVRSNSALGDNIDISHNLYYSTGGASLEYRGDWYTLSSYVAAGLEAGVVVGDPLLSDVGGADFALLDGSPAIDAGADVGRGYVGAAPDIGAHEWGE